MKIEIPGGIESIRDDLPYETKFVIVAKLQGKTREEIVLVFSYEDQHFARAGQWLDNHKGEFIGAGTIDLEEDSFKWGSTTCQDSIFGKDRPEDPEESTRLLALVREKVTQLAKTLQEA